LINVNPKSRDLSNPVSPKLAGFCILKHAETRHLAAEAFEASSGFG
jgi:hypothetical protein